MQTTTARLALAALSLILIAACQRTTGTVSEELLRTCPRDDRLWMQAVQSAEAEKRLDGLRQLAEEVARDHPDRWEPLWAAGECVVRTKPALPPEVSRELFRRALERAEALADPLGISRSSNRLGTSFVLARDYASAEPLYRKALAAAEAMQRDDLTGPIQNNLAGVLSRTGRLAEALAAMESASAILERTGRKDLALEAAYNRASLLRSLGQLSEAEKLLKRVHADAEQSGAGEVMNSACVSLGNLYLLLDETDTARSWFARVPRDHPTRAAWAALGLGRVALREGHYDEAKLQLDRALVQQADSRLQLFASTFRAAADLRSGDPAAARTRLSPILDEAEKTLNVAWMAPTLYGKALLLERSPPQQAATYFRKAIDAVEQRGAGLDPSGEGMTYLRERAEPFTEMAWALALEDSRATGPVLSVVEQAHARSLRQILREEGKSPLKLAGLESLRAGLGEDEILLDFLIDDDHGVVVAVGRSESRVALLPGWSELRPALKRYGSALRRPLASVEARLDPDADLRRDVEIGKTLRGRLLGELEPMIARARRIYVVPDQDLALLPLAALPALDSGSATTPGPFRFLGDDKEIALLLMAGTPPAGHGRRSPLLLAGDPLPDPQGEFAALPLAAAELDSVESVWRGDPSTRIQGEALSADRLRELDLGSFNTLHFATHAVASSRDPKRCAVILSAGDKLGMEEIASLHLGSALVVLSACHTGEGEVIPGEGVVGLSWSFLRAGASGVVASLWSVEDASTTELMVAFHRGLRAGADPTRALSLAQRQVRESRRHPVYWAPFVVVLSPGGTF